MSGKVKYYKAHLLTFLVRNILRRPFRVKDRNGFTFILLPEEHIFSMFRNGYLGYPEINEQECCKKLIRQNMKVFDVGANIGQFTLLFDSLVGPAGRVYSFEPCQATFRRLQNHVEMNRAHNVIAEPCAVHHQSDTKVRLNVFPSGYSVWNTYGKPEMRNRDDRSKFVIPVGEELVNTITIDDYCIRNGIERIDYLKVDVEGAEINVMQGCTDLLDRKSIRYIQFEVSEDMNKGLGLDGTEVFSFLSKFGYITRAISRNGELSDPVSSPSLSFQNFIATAAS